MKDNMPYTPDPMPFAGSSLDFMEIGRTPEQIKTYLDDPKAKAYIFVKGRPALDEDLSPVMPHPKELIGQTHYDPGPLFLGLRGSHPIFAFNLAEDNQAAPPESFQELRMIASRMNPDDLATIGRARSFLDWHYNHNYCSKCGQKTQAELSGLFRKCPSCETEHYPRVNPVVIMMVIHEDHCLLGAGHNFPEGAFSALAGFVSPGETPEAAVLREVEEEVGLKVTKPRYIFSQPWPFPSQLMMGYTCEAQSREITINKEELRAAKWVSKQTVRDVFDKKSDAFLRPPRFTIAHHLLRRWIDEET